MKENKTIYKKEVDLTNTFVIGDVHGCFHTLQNLIKKLPKNHELIFVGDLCDRGIYSKEVIEFVINNNYACIKGNHETYMSLHLEDVLYKNKKDINWLKKGWGGQATVDCYKNTNTSLVKKHLSWIKTLPSYILLDDTYFISHGYALPFFKRRDSEDEYIRHAIRSNRINDKKYKESWEDVSDYKVINIFGHCKFDEVLIGSNYYGIDTGCAYKNKLTALGLDTMSIVQENYSELDFS